MFVQTTPSSAHTAAGFFLLGCGSVNGKCCQRADRCPARDTSTTSFSSRSSPSLSSSLSGLHQLRFAGRHQRHNRRPFRYVFRPLRLRSGSLSVAVVVRFGVKVQPRLWTAYLSLRFSTHSAQVFVTDSELWPGECVSSLCALQCAHCVFVTVHFQLPFAGPRLGDDECCARVYVRVRVCVLCSVCVSHVAWTLSGKCSFSYLAAPHTQPPHKDLCLRFCCAISQVPGRSSRAHALAD